MNSARVKLLLVFLFGLVLGALCAGWIEWEGSPMPPLIIAL